MAKERFGLMARTCSTNGGDEDRHFGEIVFNLVDEQIMSKEIPTRGEDFRMSTT